MSQETQQIVWPEDHEPIIFIWRDMFLLNKFNYNTETHRYLLIPKGTCFDMDRKDAWSFDFFYSSNPWDHKLLITITGPMICNPEQKQAIYDVLENLKKFVVEASKQQIQEKKPVCATDSLLDQFNSLKISGLKISCEWKKIYLLDL